MIEGIIKTDLTTVQTESGSILHAYLQTKDNQIDIKEIYFSTIQHNAIRAWKSNVQMTINLIAVSGSVKVAIIDGRKESKSYLSVNEIILSQDPYFRLTIPPGIWYGFCGLSDLGSILCNIADHEHDPAEIERKDYDFFDYVF